MADSVLFYWFCWILWIIVTFFMKKNRLRTCFAVWILIFIIFSDDYIVWEGISISLSYVIMLFGTVVFIAYFSNWFYLFFASYIVCIGYAAFLFWETVSPVWMVLPRNFMIVAFTVIISTILVKNYLSRISVSLFGMLFGELFYSLTLIGYGLPVAIGGMSLTSVLATTLFFITLHSLQKGKHYLFHNTKKYKEQMIEVAK